MAYEPTVWQTGDVVTAEKMNKLEQGVANAGSGGSGTMIVHDSGEGTLDKTFAEIRDAMLSGILVIVLITDGGSPYMLCAKEAAYDSIEATYTVRTMGSEKYATNSEDGYPTLAI